MVYSYFAITIYKQLLQLLKGERAEWNEIRMCIRESPSQGLESSFKFMLPFNCQCPHETTTTS